MLNISQLIQEKKLLFFGGKGGVGKTTLSAATALLASQSGRKVLLVSTDPAHNLGHLLDQKIGSTPVSVSTNLDVLELDPEKTVAEHLKETSNVLRQLMPMQLASEVDKHIELSRFAPGMQEAAMLERVAQVTEDAVKNYDLVIFDTAPSGHTAQLMALPEMMSAWTDGLLNRREKSEKLRDKISRITKSNDKDAEQLGGNIFGEKKSSSLQNRDDKIRSILNRRRHRFSDLREKLINKKDTAFIIVLAAERLPVLETLELHQQLTKMEISIAGLIINKRLPENTDAFFTERKQQEEIHLAMLTSALPKIPTKNIPLAIHDIIGLEALSQFTKELLV